MRSASPLPSVRVMREGYLERERGRVVDASSNVTLIQASGQSVVVDTGSPRDAELLPELFKKAGVSLGSVSVVVNTHLHIDHIGCNDLFENARFVAHKSEDPPVGTLRISEATDLVPRVRIVPTPGHTRGSISVFVSGAENWAICGDAIPTVGNYQKHVPPSLNVDSRLAVESMDLILGWADEVVPGHDKSFKVIGKKYHA